MYRIESATAVKSDIRKLDKQLQKVIKEKHFANIEREPFNAVPLPMNLKDYGLIILTIKELNIELYTKSIQKTKSFW